VRYAAPRHPSTPGTAAEFTVPATEFERLGGKGTAKKWRQSLRLITLPGWGETGHLAHVCDPGTPTPYV